MVVPDAEPGLSRITMTAHCSPALAEQIVKQLHKQIDVISVEMTDKETSWPTSIMKSTATPA
jgi:acetolactate synthase small subunit